MCQLVSTARLVFLPGHMLLSVGCPEHAACRQSSKHINFVTLDGCPRSAVLCLQGSLCSYCTAKAFILSGQSFTAPWATVSSRLEVLAHRIVRLWRKISAFIREKAVGSVAARKSLRVSQLYPEGSDAKRRTRSLPCCWMGGIKIGMLKCCPCCS